MRNEIRAGGDGVLCWNREAVAEFVDANNAREARFAERNPDLVVSDGLIRCYGCEVQEHGYGTRCTAVLTRTLYALPDEIAPRPADAAGSLLTVPGLLTLKPDSGSLSSSTNGEVRPTAPPPASSAAAEPKRAGLRGLFGRS